MTPLLWTAATLIPWGRLAVVTYRIEVRRPRHGAVDPRPRLPRLTARGSHRPRSARQTRTAVTP